MHSAAGKSSGGQNTQDYIQHCSIPLTAELNIQVHAHAGTHTSSYRHVCTHMGAYSRMYAHMQMHTVACSGGCIHTTAKPVKTTRAFSKPPVLSCLLAFVQLLFLGLFRPCSFLWLFPRTHHLQDTVPTLTTFQTEPGGYFLGACPASAFCPLWGTTPAPSGLCSFSASQGFPRAQSVQQKMKHVWRSDNLPTRPSGIPLT